MGRRVKKNLAIGFGLVIIIGLLLAVTLGCSDGLMEDIKAKIEADIIAESPISTYTVTYDGNGNTSGDVPLDLTQYIEGETVTVLGNGSLVRDGYSFVNWNTQADGLGDTYIQGPVLTMGNADVKLYAQWTDLPIYTVTFNSQGGSAVDSQNVIEEGPVTEPPDPTRDGYTFSGWYKESECNNLWDFENDTVTEIVTLWADWVVSYTVTYSANNATTGTPPIDTNHYISGANVTAANNTGNLLRTGYTFGGWNRDSGGGGTNYTPGETFAMGAANVTLYAKWIGINYNVIFQKNDIAASGTMDYQIIPCGSSENLTTNTFTKTGWAFEGWAETTSGSVVYNNQAIYTMGTVNVTLYAKWTPPSIYKLRDRGPSGGWIFHDNGDYTQGWRYLETALSDQNNRIWGNHLIDVSGADSIHIGFGKQNTEDIVNGDSTQDKAANECDNYSFTYSGIVYDDWFLPSKNELDSIYDKLKLYDVGGFADTFYWSSSEVDQFGAWIQYFNDGTQGGYSKSVEGKVRPVRSF